MYYLVGIKKEFVHVKDTLQDTIMYLINQKNDKQLLFILEMKYDEILFKFYEYAKDWENIQTYRNAFSYTSNSNDVTIEAIVTSYGMIINELSNNPMYRWFHYCFEDVLVMEILQ